MSSIPIAEGQTVFDIAVEYTGLVSNAAKIAFANDISVNDDLIAGDLLNIPDDIEKDITVSTFFASSRSKPSSGDVNQLIEGGINFMGIEIDFIVS